MKLLTARAQNFYTPFIIYAFALAVTLVMLFPSSASAQVPMSETRTCAGITAESRVSGSGLLNTPTPITRSNERVIAADAQAGCAVIEWNTSILSTSAVIFSPATDEIIQIDLSAEHFGYLETTPQDNSGVAQHRAILTGLQPGVQYSYRLVNKTHVSALPSISEARTLSTTAAPVVTAPATPVVPPVVPPVFTGVPSAPVVPSSTGFDSEKFPITVVTPPSTPTTTTLATGTTAETGENVPSVLNAAAAALGAAQTREGALRSSLTSLLQALKPESDRLSLTSGIGLFAADTYIVPFLFLILVLFALQQLLLPSFGYPKVPSVPFWLAGTGILALGAAVFMYYAVALILIAVFLGILAWYLLRNAPENPIKLLEETKAKREAKKRAKSSAKE